MKMQLFKPLMLKFEKPQWANNPELGLLDTILESHPELLQLLQGDITQFAKNSVFGRQDTPSIEQIVRAALYKELKGLDYRDLEFHQEDSRIGAIFMKIDELRPYSFQVYHKYISLIKAENLEKFMIKLNQIAISEGLEDVEKLRIDSTVVESNIHYPTNNSLVWDCIKQSHRLLSQLKNEAGTLEYRDYLKGAKKTFFKINVTKGDAKKKELFVKQLVSFTKCINQVANVIKKKAEFNTSIGQSILKELESLLPVMRKVFSMTQQWQVNGVSVKNEDKIFSIYEQHTAIIVKGSREIQYGHKVNLSSGKSRLILDCELIKGNPKDTSLYQKPIQNVKNNYQITPRDLATDGGYASLDNLQYAQKEGITNIVFNKIVGSLKNVTSSINMETRLKKWRSGMEAVISNLKRGFNISRCTWKGEAHFSAKVFWSVIGYNIRVMSSHFIGMMKI